MGRGLGIGIALLALPALCPVSRGDDAPAAARGAWIGVSTRGLSDDWREREDYWARGVMVVEVARGSPADQAGMGPGDVLVSVDSHTLQNPSDLTEAEGGMEPGRAVPVVLARDGGRVIKIFNLEPGTMPGVAEAVPTPPPPPAEEAATTAAAAPAAPAPAEVHRNGAADLGVRCENLSFDLAEALGAIEGQGVLVLKVLGGSPADRAGIRPGDVISWVGDQPVVDVDRLERAVASAPSPVNIVTRRGGTTRNVMAEFDAQAAAGEAAAKSDRTDELSGDALVAALRDEVRGLRDEVQKLREELALVAKAAARQP
jgi:predicted metalloprotease with PDZ domain